MSTEYLNACELRGGAQRLLTGQHRRLHFLADRLHLLCLTPADALPSGRFSAVLLIECEGFATLLEEHFRAEEQSYMPEVRSRWPELRAAVDRLEDHHHRLRASWRELFEKAHGLPVLTLQREILERLVAIKEHEIAETPIVQTWSRER